MATQISPKESKSVLEPTRNTFAVENGILYDYFSIKLGERRGDYVDITKLPPVIRPGFVTFQKKLYKLELRDFFRSRLNVGQPAFSSTISSDTGADAADATANPTVTNVDTTTESDGQSRVDSTFGVQVNQAADVAWEDQIRALLFADDPEAQWEFETATQS